MQYVAIAHYIFSIWKDDFNFSFFFFFFFLTETLNLGCCTIQSKNLSIVVKGMNCAMRTWVQGAGVGPLASRIWSAQ